MEPHGLMRPISKDEQKEHRGWLSVFLLDTGRTGKQTETGGLWVSFVPSLQLLPPEFGKVRCRRAWRGGSGPHPESTVSPLPHVVHPPSSSLLSSFSASLFFLSGAGDRVLELRATSPTLRFVCLFVLEAGSRKATSVLLLRPPACRDTMYLWI